MTRKLKDKVPNHDKYVTAPEFNKLTKENFDERFKQANFTSKNGTDNFIKNADFDNELRNINNRAASNRYW